MRRSRVPKLSRKGEEYSNKKRDTRTLHKKNLKDVVITSDLTLSENKQAPYDSSKMVGRIGECLRREKQKR